MNILIFGHKGWIGSMISQYLNDLSIQWTGAKSRADNYLDSYNEIVESKCTHVLSLIGRTHGGDIKTIDYLELPNKLDENVRDNLYAPLNLALICEKLGIHYSYLGTGCIYSSFTSSFTEEDEPNFIGSSYSIVKSYTDRIFKNSKNVLNLRIRMPISFITKILNYKKICSINNSMTILDDFIPIFIDMMKNKIIGTFNCTNPNNISHNEILEMYREISNEKITWENMTIDQQDTILLAKRSNNTLNTSKIQTLYPELKDIKISIKKVLENYVVLRSLNKEKC